MRRRTWLVEWVADELTLGVGPGLHHRSLNKKGVAWPVGCALQFPRLSLSSSRNSLPSIIGKRGECSGESQLNLGNKFASLRKSHTMRTGC